MALKKIVKTTYGIDIDHWVIESVKINDKFKFAEITILGYFSEEQYKTGASPIQTLRIKCTAYDGFDEIFSKNALKRNRSFNDIYALAYEYLKNTMDFKQSLDC